MTINACLKKKIKDNVSYASTNILRSDGLDIIQ